MSIERIPMNSEAKLQLSWSHSKSYVGRTIKRKIHKTKLAAYVKIMNSRALGFLTKKTKPEATFVR